jgi:hypothetical protein
MVVVFIRKNCIQMVFVYFAFIFIFIFFVQQPTYEVKQGEQSRIENSSCKPQKAK